MSDPRTGLRVWAEQEGIIALVATLVESRWPSDRFRRRGGNSVLLLEKVIARIRTTLKM
jgi:hypothetical protein